MKTAISIPDRVFEAAEQLAHQLGLSRSELYAKAVAAYLEQHRRDHITERLNRVYSQEPSGLDPLITQMQSASLTQENW
jgi:metal-responsive CopG/Arc/MetJ family transcriptional regulator